MKRLITFMLALLVGTTVTMAKEPKTIQEVISSQLKVPAELLTENFEKVSIDFKMKTNGEVELVKVHSMNKELRKEITEHFCDIDFTNAEKLSEGNYTINVFFKVL